MGVHYDRAKVSAWYTRLEDELGARDLVILWTALAYQADYRASMSEDGRWLMSGILAEWRAFSLWERQQALYLFVPCMENLAKTAAHKMAQQARVQEPL